jgi:hypothetical protein
MNLNIYTGYRLQMTGFDSAPFPGEPRNLEYYPALMQNAGYEVHATWRSWDMPNEYDLALPFWTAAAATGKDAVGGLAKEGRTTFDRLGPPGRTYSVLAKTL